MHATVELHELAAKQNSQLEIIPGSQAVERLFGICRLTNALPFRTAE